MTNGLFNDFTTLDRSSLTDKFLPQYVTPDAKIDVVAKINELKENAKMKIPSNPMTNRRSFFKEVRRSAYSGLPGIVMGRKVAFMAKSVIDGLIDKIFTTKRIELRRIISMVMEDMSFPFLKKSFWDSLRTPTKLKSV